MASKNITAKESAVQDIMEDLAIQGKSFLAFRRNLDPIMEELVEKELKAQEDRSSSKIAWCL